MLKTFTLISLTLFFLFAASVHAAGWDLSLTVTIPYTGAEGEVARTTLILGAHPSATDGFDNVWDTPGFLENVLRAYFLHEDYSPPYQRLWRDVRSNRLPQEWDLWILPSQAGSPVTFNWSSADLSNLPSSLRVRLVDLESGSQELDMRSATTYSYAHADQTTAHHFRIMVDEPAVTPPPGDSTPPAGVPPVDTPPAETPPQVSPPAVHILTDVLPPGFLERHYMTRLEAEGGTVPYRWKIVSGHLPPGLKLYRNTGVITGRPRHAGTYRFTIQLVDDHGLILKKALTLSISRKSPPQRNGK